MTTNFSEVIILKVEAVDPPKLAKEQKYQRGLSGTIIEPRTATSSGYHN